MPLFHMKFKALGLCAALFCQSTLAQTDDFWSEDVWKAKDRGFLYYPEAQKSKQKRPELASTPLSELKSAEELKAEHAKRLSLATFNPTEENVLAFQEVNYFVQEKAALFTDMFRRVSWQNPHYDFSTLHPAANFAQVSLSAQKSQNRSSHLPELTQDWGLMYFYRSDCRFCALQSPLVKKLQEDYGFDVLAVSLDASSNPLFPDALPDNGVSKLLTNGEGLSRVPALFMVKRDQSASFLVSSGVLSLEDMLKRIETLALQNPGESLFAGSQALNQTVK